MEIVKKYFKISPRQQRLLEAYVELLKDWNGKVNLISRKDMDAIWEHHILHSLAIAKVVDFSNTKVIDVGTGGGLPGIPLSILYPKAEFTLIDSIGKKINVVNDIIERLQLTNVEAIKTRSTEHKGKYDFIVARAVTDFRRFYKETKHLLVKGKKTNLHNGIIYLKGGDFDQEINPFKKQTTVFEISSFFEEEFFATKKIIYFRYE